MKRMAKLPKDEISYFGNGRVKSVRIYSSIGDTVGNDTYRRWGDKFFMSFFDEHHAGSGTDIPTAFEKLPEQVKEIFAADTREGVQALREQKKLRNYIDA